jgi:hypothetical protein
MHIRIVEVITIDAPSLVEDLHEPDPGFDEAMWGRLAEMGLLSTRLVGRLMTAAIRQNAVVLSSGGTFVRRIH